MKNLLLLLLFVVSVLTVQAQYISKVGGAASNMYQTASGNIGVGTTVASQRFQVNGGNALITGTRFAQVPDTASLFLGNTNQAVVAYYGRGMGLNVYQKPNAMFIANGGRVGIGTTTPTAYVDIEAPYCSPYCYFLRVGNGNYPYLSIDNQGNVYVGSSMNQNANTYFNSALPVWVSTDTTGGVQIDSQGVVATTAGNGSMMRLTAQGIQFPDGTTQTTSCQPATAAATVKHVVRKRR